MKTTLPIPTLTPGDQARMMVEALHTRTDDDLRSLLDQGVRMGAHKSDCNVVQSMFRGIEAEMGARAIHSRTMKAATLAGVITVTGIVLLPELAHAQVLGGGGSGQLSQLIQWVISNIVRVAISAGVIGVAIALLMFRFNFALVAMVAVGGLIAANYTTIAGFFGV